MERMPDGRSFYITTPIYYPSDVPHIGHGYSTVAVDTLARWHRQAGDDTWMLTGTDEHGQKMLRTAAANGATPQEWVDRLVAESWYPVLRTLDIANDDFIRTTQGRHERNVQTFLQRVYDRGYIYAGEYEALYCVGCEEFKPESEIQDGTGPFEGLKVCAIHSKPLELLHEKNYFFKLSEFQDELLKLYTERPDFVQPESARNEVIQFVKHGLKDLSISRSTFDWGIKVPWDETHVVYVWFDALLNYATAVGYGEDDEQFARRWPATHIVGKDILRFHAVIWPAMLMAAGIEVPHQVFAHGWLLVGGEKMSKSKLTGISPEQIIDHFGSDAFRYHFLRAIQFGQDGSFSWEDMAARYTAELANGLGNLASRATAMVGRYCDGVLPAAHDFTEAEHEIARALAEAASTADRAMGELDFSTGITAVKDFVERVNGYVTEQEPWVLAKDPANADRLGVVLYTICDSLRAIAVLYNPVMPKAMSSLWEQLGAQAVLGPLAEQRIATVGEWAQLPPGTLVVKGEGLFPRLDDAP